MTSFEELRNERVRKLEELRLRGINPYPATTSRTHTIGDVIASFDALLEKKLTIAGRVIAIRGHGALVFADIYDGTGTMQVYLKEDTLKDFSLFTDFVDIGDFVEVTGTATTTKRGERSILGASWKMLTKSLRPIPEKWYGLHDTEERLRRRYLDILANADVRDMVFKKAMFWQSIREFLLERGFLEVETPVLETVAGGADARPFITHHHALDIDVYLRISCGELWQKRLMVAGFPKVFEIGRIFRNEGMSAEHLQDYTQMEFYSAYTDYAMGMELVEALFKYVAEKTFGTLTFTIGEHTVDLGTPWERYDFRDTIKEHAGVDIDKATLDDVEEALTKLGVTYDKAGWNMPRAIDQLWKYTRKKLSGPGFLINVPVYMEPLAKRHEDNKDIVERFQVIIAGSETGKGYSELNDPLDQRERFEEQEKLRKAGDAEAQMMDEDFVEALEYGMPPTCGFGMSERVFAFLMNKPVRETQIFPLMRPKQSE